MLEILEHLQICFFVKNKEFMTDREKALQLALLNRIVKTLMRHCNMAICSISPGTLVLDCVYTHSYWSVCIVL